MKRYSKASVFGAVLVLSTALASADTIQLGSFATGGANLGNKNSAVAFVGLPTTTFQLNPGIVWAAPGINSVWVSNNANSGPGGSVIEAPGTYSYITTFILASSNYSGSIWVLADDTTDILLNGNMVAPEGNLGNDAQCATGTPNCRTPTLINLPASDFVTGLNTLQFDLDQTLASTGLDFYGSISTPVSSSVPEPASLMLLGTGLIGSVVVLRKRIAKSST